MQAQLQKILDWLAAKSQRDRVIVMLVAFAAIYFLWDALVAGSSMEKSAKLATETQKIEQDISSSKQQIQALTAGLTELPSPQLIKKQANLKEELATVNQQLAVVQQKSMTSEQMLATIRALFEQIPELSLTKLEDTPPKPIKQANQAQGNLYEHGFIIEFHGDYFSTVHYLQALASLPQRFFLDELDYQVKSYPEAKIILKLHTREAS